MTVVEKSRILLRALSVLLLVGTGQTTHFRGGTISCEPVLDSTTNGGITANGYYKIRCGFRIAWRRSFNAGTGCTKAQRDAQTLINGPGSTAALKQCSSSGCTTTIDPLNFKCTEISESEDWTQGSRTFVKTFQASQSEMTYRLSSCCWITTLVTGGGSDYNWGITFSLTKRSDTGILNRSPQTEALPIYRLQSGCKSVIAIPTGDSDGDVVRCRWASGNAECGGVCNAVPGATLKSDSCEMTFTPASTGWYAAAVSIEDFPRSNPNGNRLSVVPLQFLINVYRSSTACAANPKLIWPSPTDRSCVPVPPGETYTATLAALAPSTGVTIKSFKLLPPAGLQRGELQLSLNGTLNQGKLTVTWTPTPSQYGQQFIFCFSAEDSSGKSSNQTCIFLLAGASPPVVIPGSKTPKGTADSARVPRVKSSFSIDFDQQIHKPQTSKYIHIFEKYTDAPSPQVLALDTSVSPDVFVRKHPIHQKRYRLSFVISKRLNIFSDFYILIDEGAVIGNRSCGKGGAPWAGISDPNYWTFSTNDEVGNITDCRLFFSQMVDYGTTTNDQQLMLGNGSSCQKFNISLGGLSLWGVNHKELSVCENGQILMDLDTAIRHPQFFPAKWETQPTLFAPYWCLADNSYSKTLRPGVRSHVWYHEYTSSPQITISERQMLKAINGLVTAKYHNKKSSFRYQATWALVATWERISPYPSTYQYQVHNTFQAILTTDGLRSFALFAYDGDSIQWSVPQSRDPRAKYGHGVVGFTSPSTHYTDPRSESGAISFIDNYPDENSQYLLPQPCTYGAMYIFKLYKEVNIRGSHSKCKQWYSLQPPPRTWLEQLPACPCIISQALSDRNFRQVFHKSETCFQSVAPSEGGHAQECCYRTSKPGFGALLKYPKGGHPQYYSLMTNPTKHQSSELDAYHWCCRDSKLCKFFYARRPTQGCQGYEPPGVALSIGNLFRTFDGRMFLFNAPGEFRLLNIKTPTRGRRSVDKRERALMTAFSGFTLQGRASVLPGEIADGYATAFTAFAAGGQNIPKVQVQIVTGLAGTQQMAVFINGKDFFAPLIKTVIDADSPGGKITSQCDFLGQNCQQIELSKATPTPKNSFFLPKPGVYVQGNVTINVRSSSCISLVFASGIVINVCYRAPGFLLLTPQVPTYLKPFVSGLLGDWNDQPADDLKTPDGMTLSANSSLDVVHNSYGLSWLSANVGTKTSLFTDVGFAPGSDFSASRSRQFIPSFVTGLTKPGMNSSQVVAVCGSDISCIWSSAHYSDTVDVRIFKKHNEELDETRKNLDSFPPVFDDKTTNNWIVNAEKGRSDKAKTYFPIAAVNPQDPNKPVHIQLGGTAPNGLSVRVVTDGAGKTWCELEWDNKIVQTLTGTLQLPFVLIATNDNGKSSILQPTIDVCLCQHGGKCDQQAISEQGVLSIATCTCTDAYSGAHCETDKDGCEAAFQPCFSGVSCIDVKAPGVGYQCGPCPAGFSGNGKDCYDFDECLANSTLCHQQCINTQTGYNCGCYQGFKLNGDQRTCKDINECDLRLDNCQQLCSNTRGSFLCSCFHGYALNPDNRTCKAISSCSSSNACDQFCSMEGSSVVCSCGSGWELTADSTTCRDVDECNHPRKPCQGKCTNTLGSFNCSCTPGYRLAEDQSTCEDIDECLTPPCPLGQQCINTLGNYSCACPIGYELDTQSQTCKEEKIPVPTPVWPDPAIGKVTTNRITLRLPGPATPITYEIYRQLPGAEKYSFLLYISVGSQSSDFEVSVDAWPGLQYNFIFRARQGDLISPYSSVRSVITPGVWPRLPFGQITSHSVVLHLPSSATQVYYDIYMSTSGGEPWRLLSTVQSQTTDFSYLVRTEPDTTYWFSFDVRSGNLTSSRSSVHSVTTENPAYFAFVQPMVARLQEGNSIEFRCIHTLPDPSPVYNWSRVDGKPLPVGRSGLLGELGQSVYIRNTRPADSGRYLCTVSTDFGDFASTGELVITSVNTVNVGSGERSG